MMGPKLINAALTHFTAERERAEATLLAYCNHSVGIADHSNLVGEVIKSISELTDAEERIKMCESLLEQNKKKK
jgi:putative hemolysin